MSEPERHRVYVASYLVLKHEGKILFQKRYGGYMSGNYGLPSGHIEEGETARRAIVREAFEEIGVELQGNDLEVVHIMHRKKPDREYIDFFITAQSWSGVPENKEPEKCTELAWFDFDSLPENIVPEVKYALECMEQGIWHSEFCFDS